MNEKALLSMSMVRAAGALLAAATTISCATMGGKPLADREIVVSIKDQKLALLEQGRPVAVYPVSTSQFGLGDTPGSGSTPLGRLKVARKIGGGAPPGAVFKSRQPTGEVLPPNAPGRDPIVTRILWLDGQEPRNARAYSRHIYIHGTPQESVIGRPASYGCVRMRSQDVIDLFDRVPPGTDVNITQNRLPGAARTLARHLPNHASPALPTAPTVVPVSAPAIDHPKRQLAVKDTFGPPLP